MPRHLDALIERVRALRTLPSAVARRAAPKIKAAIDAQIARGQAPDGTTWKPTKKGEKPLRNAAKAVDVTSSNSKVIVTLTGPEVFHNSGTGKDPKRQILPRNGEVPEHYARAVHEAIDEEWRARFQ